ncbi:MAG TPA: cytochrome c oxidase assembly protein [Gammaproteobacteria bacterium]|nr:cytochrome c oxidase assembly protein [Gammaproteobacteria bacterium]
MQKSSRKTIGILALVVAVMFGFSFALVPLYRLACKKIGLNTSVPLSNAPDLQGVNAQIVMGRNVTVQFITMTNKGFNWDFYPITKSVQIHPGESKKVIFYAKNNTKQDMVVQAIPSMTPTESISHFHKIECFCFNQQSLKAGEAKQMALVFQVDKDLPKEVNTITLAYTLFDATPKK